MKPNDNILEEQIEELYNRIGILENKKQETATTTAFQYAGVLVEFPSDKTGIFITVEITCNGYQNSPPTKTLVQAYHYNTVGNFILPQQKNITGNVEKCSFGIIDNKVVLWIPFLTPFATYIIKTHTNQHGFNNHSATLKITKPNIEHETQCAVS